MTRSILFLALSAFVLASCTSNSVANRKRPDEFAVTREAPLVIPPEYNLEPPKPGQPRPIETDSQQQALEAMFGPGVKLPPKSKIENLLLSDANADRADSAIRNTVENPIGGQGTVVVDKGQFLRELMDAPTATRDAKVARVEIEGVGAAAATPAPAQN